MKSMRTILISLVAFVTVQHLYLRHTAIKPVPDYSTKSSLIPYNPGTFSKDRIAIHKLYFANGVTCTGFVIDDNYLITAAHCVADGVEPVRVLGKKGMYSVVSTLVDRDLALISGDFKGDARARISFKEEYFGSGIGVASGYPGKNITLFMSNIVLTGKVNGKIMAEGIIYPGMSGGPMAVLRNGNIVIIGVNHAVDTHGKSYFASIVGADVAFGIN